MVTHDAKDERMMVVSKMRLRGDSLARAWLIGAGLAITLAAVLFPASRILADSPTPTAVVVKAEDVTAKVALSDARSSAGGQLGVTIAFEVAPGWHIYGEPMPSEFTTTKIKFDDQLLSAQSLKMPAPTPVKFEALGETYPVYHGKFNATGKVGLKPTLAPGDYKLAGTLEFQECNDTMCKLPQSVHFEIPLMIAVSKS
jgi:DsbC/DsbD-like thiol-disulfide interchange protein